MFSPSLTYPPNINFDWYDNLDTITDSDYWYRLLIPCNHLYTRPTLVLITIINHNYNIFQSHLSCANPCGCGWWWGLPSTLQYIINSSIELGKKKQHWPWQGLGLALKLSSADNEHEQPPPSRWLITRSNYRVDGPWGRGWLLAWVMYFPWKWNQRNQTATMTTTTTTELV
jgi:hypothetical protein